MDAGAVGDVALWGATATSGIALVGGLAARRHPNAPAVTSAAGLATIGLATVAVGALVWSLLTGDFSLASVADTTTRQGGWPYRLAGLWGGNGGSLLLWAWIMLLAGFWATRGPARRPARLIATLAGGAVLMVVAVAADPFQRLAIPAIDGGGLTPILRYPAMLYHPPLLYAGHAGLAAPFALAVAGLATGRRDAVWLASTRRWMLAAWLLLGIGLLAGAHWSYVELGWGGFWAWDPVENGGLLPLLAATVFLHRARRAPVSPDRGHSPGLAALAALPFCLSLLGATLSRSGAAQSVHAFAQAGAVGRGLLAVLIVAVTTVIALALHSGSRTGSAPPGRPLLLSEDTALVGAVIVLLAMVVVVTVGTAFPAVVHIVTGDHLAVTSRYYALVLTPLALILVALMGAGPALPGTGLGPDAEDPHRPRPRRAPPVMAVAAGVTAFAVLGGPRQVAAAGLGAGAAFALVMALSQLAGARRLRRAGALAAHAGVALLLLGVAGSLRGSQSTEVVRLGATAHVGGFSLHYRDVATGQGSGWRRVTVILDVSRDGRPVGVLHPGLRVFDNQVGALSDISLHSTVTRDLIVAVRQVDPASRAAQLEMTVRPLVTLVWWGGLLAAGGGLMVLAGALGTRPGGTSPPIPLEPGCEADAEGHRIHALTAST